MDRDASFGNWLTLRRKALRLSRVELARRVGCATVTLRKIEADERRPSRQIAERLVEHLALLPADQALFLSVSRSQLTLDRLPLPNVVVPPSDGDTTYLFPLPSTSLVGRAHEIVAIREQLSQPTIRLLTLLGAPGIGKTRLAVTAAHALRDAFRDGVVWIPLATLFTPDQVVPTIARALGIAARAGQPVLVQLQQTLRSRNMLLILDNFEHVVEAAPTLANLLAATHQLKLLVTSRVALRVSAEQRFDVSPLTVSPNRLTQQALRKGESWQSLARYEAIALFIQRAQTVLPAFELCADNALAVAEICRRLDGLPLAIELAAARSTLLTPDEILTHLEHRFALLSGGAVDLPGRQHTLRQAIAWSYDLLAPGAQTLFRRLAVFSGGWTVAAARMVCDADALGINILDGLAVLLDSSLIVRQAQGNGQSRFGMLETIRAFAEEQLAAADDSQSMRQRHLTYYLALAEQDRQWDEPQRRNRLTELRQEQSNMRAALAFAIAHGASGHGLRLIAALEAFWFNEGYHGEGYQWATMLLAETRTALTSAQHAQALSIVGFMAWQHGNYLAARTPLEESVAIYRQLDDPANLTEVLSSLGRALLFQGEHVQACAMLDESVTLAQQLGNRASLARALQGRAYVALHRADYGEARLYQEQRLTVDQTADDRFGIAQALNDLGDVARCEGDYDQAAILYQESLTRFRAADMPVEIAAILHNLGYVALAHNDLPLAHRQFRESLTLQQERQNLPGILENLAGFGALLAYQGHPWRAAVLFGAILELRAALNAPMWPAEQVEFDRHFGKVAATLGRDSLELALNEGRQQTLDDMTADALSAPQQAVTDPC